ncbi:Kelch motif family protein [Tritrichomonas foetus]|uniref:Kelch motif family protein n=1 Tax=Tritrichomonas foetus TaxID=1144522 RepID=A0A1J4KID4_9EUKA|nr:Kelch motif family protein [Tritrichomonas foetus]|eukprot:OHT09446.1 Kelch motif family protein [Tritrichomonas foetus]
MGGDSSVATDQFSHPYCNDLYVPVGEPRMNSERKDASAPTNNLKLYERRPNLLKSAFSGIWSVRLPASIAPIPRTGHFYVYDQDEHRLFVGYGIDSQNQTMSDLWCLDTHTHKWNKIRLTGSIYSGRSGSRAIILKNPNSNPNNTNFNNNFANDSDNTETSQICRLIIFGGFAEQSYYADLHAIDIMSDGTGIVSPISTTGEAPSPRSSPIFVKYEKYIYLWGGFNGEWPTSLHVLDLETLNWTEHPQDIAGRITVPGVILQNRYFAYGGSKSGGMIVLDFESRNILLTPTTGSEPPSGVLGSGMALVERYLFFFGGKAASNWTLMYACDIEKMWWFVFHVMPDGDTVSIADGTISELGLFMLPRIHSFAVCYVREMRQIMACLGAPEKDPPPLFIVNIGEAMGVIHLREDMLDMIPK